jgi:hypothetical protein
MQYSSDTDLATAITNPDVTIDGLVEFDWNRDGLYEHEYSDLSWLHTNVSNTAATITGDLPEQVNTLTGASSSEIMITFGGVKYGDAAQNITWSKDLAEQGLSADQVFSPWWAASPLFGIPIEGTPIRWSRVVHTTTGEHTIRQFTGWVRDFDIDRATRTVQLVASDIIDMQPASVTLPLWAISPNFWNNSVNTTGVGRPISATWVIEEILRQSGRPTGPATKGAAVAYLSCNGSFLPSVGTMADADEDAASYYHWITVDNPEPWRNGNYGICPKYNPQTSFTTEDSNLVNFRASTGVEVPQHGTADPPRTITWSGWVESDGTALINPPDSYPYPDRLMWEFQLDDWYDPSANAMTPGAITGHIYRNGQFYMWVRESASEAIPQRVWSWYWHTVLAAGWHYIHVRFAFTNSSVTIQTRVNGIITAPTSQTVPAFGYRTYGPLGVRGKTNYVTVHINIPSQHWQIAAGVASLDYVAGEQDPPLRDGLPLAVVTPSPSELSWIPNRYDKPAWDLLREVANAEYGAVYTNEYGQIVFAPHYDLRTDLPGQVATAREINDDNLLTFVVSPSVDQYRNCVTISATQRHQEPAIIWAPASANQFSTSTGAVIWNEIEVSDSEVVAVDSSPRQIFADIPAYTTDRPIRTESSAVRMSNVNTDASAIPHTNWSFAILVAPNQRTFTLIRNGGTGGSGEFIGSYIGGGRVSMQIAGRRYSQRTVVRREFVSEISIAENDNRRRVLPIADNDWRNTVNSITAIGNELLLDTVIPAPLVDGIQITADPRLQKRDVIKLTSETGISGAMYGQIIGIQREDSATAGSVDTPILRVLGVPGAAIWDDPDLGWDTGRWST